MACSLKLPDPRLSIVITAIENIDQAKMLVEVDIKKRDVKEVVNEWLDNNPDKWKSWLPK